VTALAKGYDNICQALESLAEDDRQTAETRYEATHLWRSMHKLETIFLTFFWKDVLTRFNEVNNTIQKVDITMATVVRLYASLKGYVTELRDQFGYYETIANNKMPQQDYADNGSRRKIISSRLRYLEGGSSKTPLSGQEKFRTQTFIPVIDAITLEISNREKAYQFIDSKFSYFSQLHCLSNEEICSYCKILVTTYHEDLEEDNLFDECVQFKHYIQTVSSLSLASASSIYSYLKENALESVFPNMEISLRMYCSMMASNCTAERSFSKMSLIKNTLRSTMLEVRLNSLSILSIENDILQDLDFSDIISSFATMKSHKKGF
jgi:hypothetical protein